MISIQTDSIGIVPDISKKKIVVWNIGDIAKAAQSLSQMASEEGEKSKIGAPKDAKAKSKIKPVDISLAGSTINGEGDSLPRESFYKNNEVVQYRLWPRKQVTNNLPTQNLRTQHV